MRIVHPAFMARVSRSGKRFLGVLSVDFLCVCVRIPKCGSSSLTHIVNAAFSKRRTFYLPHTLNLDASISSFQDLRFVRTRARNLLMHYRTASIRKAFDIISSWAADGDLLAGGHIDFHSVRNHIDRKVQMITIFREPEKRVRSEYNYSRLCYLDRGPFRRFDSGMRHKAAGKYDFDGFLDFLLDNRQLYGDVAARYVGWDGQENLDEFFARNVFHSGVLEQSDAFEKGLSDKMGVNVSFPHKNRTKKNHESGVTAAQRSKIEQIYSRDFALYEWQLAHV